MITVAAGCHRETRSHRPIEGFKNFRWCLVEIFSDGDLAGELPEWAARAGLAAVFETPKGKFRDDSSDGATFGEGPLTADKGFASQADAFRALG